MTHVDPEGRASLGHCRSRCAACTRALDSGKMTDREERSYSIVMLGSALTQLFDALEKI